MNFILVPSRKLPLSIVILGLRDRSQMTSPKKGGGLSKVDKTYIYIYTAI